MEENKEVQETPQEEQAATPQEEQATPEVPQVEDKGAHDDYDWSGGANQKLSYTEDEITKYLKEYESTLNAVEENALVKAKVTHVTSGDIVLDIGSKSDGLVSLSEFRDTPDLKEGDLIEVYVETLEDDRGQLVLSRRKAKLLRAWEDIKDSFTNGTVIKGTVVSKTKGGLIVDCGGLETFLPGSQIDIKPIIDYDQYVGKTMDSRLLRSTSRSKMQLYLTKRLSKAILQFSVSRLLQVLKKVRYLKVLLRTLQTSVHSLTLVVLMVYCISQISLGVVSMIQEKCLSLTRKSMLLFLTLMRTRNVFLLVLSNFSHTHGRYWQKMFRKDQQLRVA